MIIQVRLFDPCALLAWLWHVITQSLWWGTLPLLDRIPFCFVGRRLVRSSVAKGQVAPESPTLVLQLVLAEPQREVIIHL